MRANPTRKTIRVNIWRAGVQLGAALILAACQAAPISASPTRDLGIPVTAEETPASPEPTSPAIPAPLAVTAEETPVAPAQAAPTNVFLPMIANPKTVTPTNSYYFDSAGGSDQNSGRSPDQAWRTISKINSTSYKPGDVILFKRGSTWTGNTILDSSGTREKPIRFTAYGDPAAPAPTFRNPDSSGSRLTSAIKITGDWNVLENVLVRDARLAGVYIETGADYNLVQNIEATRVGEGVNVHGQHNWVLYNHIHDLTMVTNTPGGDDDYGAVGVWLFNHYNEVAYNRIINCKAASYDYDFDGGAVELYNSVNGSSIHHNYAFNTQGFTEIGGKPGSTAYDNVIAYNVMVNSGRPIGLHLSGGFASDVRNLRFEHNTVVDTTTDFYAAILFLGADATPDMLTVRNNIFYLQNFDKLATHANFTHDHNLYYLPNGKLGFSAHATEVIADPRFVNLSAGDFHLHSGSPAIDKGTDLGYDTDYDLLSVPVGGKPDLGAFEYQAP